MVKKLLIVDDDLPFRERLTRSMEKKGFEVTASPGFKESLVLAEANLFDYAIVDMRLEDGSGLELLKEIKKISPNTKSLLLTGYGNIATAVAAIKSGAIDYLPKPAEIDQIYDALTNHKETLPPPPENPMTADRIRWEHIQRVFIQCNRNVSETARRLRMHRRTLQRILNKHAPRE
ncbi:ActR/PrrA/RegA family redox response regulator transcription factor [Pelagibacteraceae bacterium]|nr:ActR/PrrA/RegA family redox response regulator transcription factor [Pelagibacteraceae bacterium]